MSRIYDVYWHFKDRRIIDELKDEVAFYRRHLQGWSRDALVFDIGANLGTKTWVFLRLGARVIAVDPDPQNQVTLRQTFTAWRFCPRVTVVGKAVSEHDGVETLWMNGPGDARNTLSEKWVNVLRHDVQRFGTSLDFCDRRTVETVTLDGLIAQYGMPFFIKIDVEGHEPEVLRGLSRPPRYVSFEVNLPEFRDEGEACITLLAQLDATGQFNYATSCGPAGLALPRWTEAESFLSVFRNCHAPAIEVFWRQPVDSALAR